MLEAGHRQKNKASRANLLGDVWRVQWILFFFVFSRWASRYVTQADGKESLSLFISTFYASFFFSSSRNEYLLVFIMQTDTRHKKTDCIEHTTLSQQINNVKHKREPKIIFFCCRLFRWNIKFNMKSMLDTKHMNGREGWLDSLMLSAQHCCHPKH